MKTLLTLLSLLTILNTNALVLTSFDSANDCKLITVLKKVKDENGDRKYPRELTDNETIISKKSSYGLALENIKIDFENKLVSANLEIRLILAKDIDQTIQIKSDNPNFDELISYHNHSIVLWDKVCLDSDNNLIYAIDSDKK